MKLDTIITAVKTLLKSAEVFAKIEQGKVELAVKNSAQELKIEYKNDRNNSNKLIDN